MTILGLSVFTYIFILNNVMTISSAWSTTDEVKEHISAMEVALAEERNATQKYFLPTMLKTIRDTITELFKEKHICKSFDPDKIEQFAYIVAIFVKSCTLDEKKQIDKEIKFFEIAQENDKEIRDIRDSALDTCTGAVEWTDATPCVQDPSDKIISKFQELKKKVSDLKTESNRELLTDAISKQMKVCITPEVMDEWISVDKSFLEQLCA